MSVAERLQQRIGGRLLDNHTIFNVAFSLCDFRSPEFYETVRAVRQIAFTTAIKLPPSVPILLTNANANTSFGRENWAAIKDMAKLRASVLCNILLDCSIEENNRRLQSPDRARMRKLIDPEALARSREKAELLAEDGDHLLRLDVTELMPEETAHRIEEWLRKLGLLSNR